MVGVDWAVLEMVGGIGVDVVVFADAVYPLGIRGDDEGGHAEVTVVFSFMMRWKTGSFHWQRLSTEAPASSNGSCVLEIPEFNSGCAFCRGGDAVLGKPNCGSDGDGFGTVSDGAVDGVDGAKGC